MSVAPTDGNKHEAVEGQLPGVNIFLRPIAAPSALGLTGFAIGTWITSTWLADWYGTTAHSEAPTAFFEFVTVAGGFLQLWGAWFAFYARDETALVLHGVWGSFWVAWGFHFLLQSVGVIPKADVYGNLQGFAMWFAPITVFTYAGAIGCLARDFILFLTTFFLATGSLFALIGWFLSSASAVTVLVKIAAYFWMVSSVLAMYWVASKVIKENWGKTSRGKDWLPIFETKIQRNKSEVHPAVNEPGVKHGQ